VGLKVESRLVLKSLKLPAAHLCLLLASSGNAIFAISDCSHCVHGLVYNKEVGELLLGGIIIMRLHWLPVLSSKDKFMLK
jgi:hypothetical protein